MDAAEMAYLKEMCVRLNRYGSLASEAYARGEHAQAEALQQKQTATLEEIYEHFGIGVR